MVTINISEIDKHLTLSCYKTFLWRWSVTNSNGQTFLVKSPKIPRIDAPTSKHLPCRVCPDYQRKVPFHYYAFSALQLRRVQVTDRNQTEEAEVFEIPSSEKKAL
jgi:hypothetical protein